MSSQEEDVEEAVVDGEELPADTEQAPLVDFEGTEETEQ